MLLYLRLDICCKCLFNVKKGTMVRCQDIFVVEGMHELGFLFLLQLIVMEYVQEFLNVDT
jgi:hypothetical protein